MSRPKSHRMNILGDINMLKRILFKSFSISSLISLSIISIASIAIPTAAFSETNQQTIQDDVNRIYSGNGLQLAKQIEVALRTGIEQLVDASLNRGLYMQNILRDKSGNPVPNLELIQTHYEKFCSPADASMLGGATSNCIQDISLQDADLKLSNLLVGSRLNDVGLQGATRFVENLIDPLPNSPVQDGLYPDSSGKKQPITMDRIKGDTALQNDLANVLITQALLSVPRHSLAEMISKRQDIPGSSQTMMEQFEKQACQRFMNTTWQQNIQLAYTQAMNVCDPTVIPGCTPGKPLDPSKQADPAKGAAIEADLLAAIRTCLDFERFKQMERVEALLAAQLVHQVRTQQQAAAFVKSSIPTGTPTPGGSSNAPKQ